MAYFNAQYLPEPKEEFVCWLDIMGTKSTMSTSLKSAANFIFKLHSTIIDHKLDGISLYPVMDGVYITSKLERELIQFLADTFTELAENFIKESNPFHKFLVKASVSFGPIIHGVSLPSAANVLFDRHTDYKKSILLGLPIVQSFLSENLAPPFGVFIHESARSTFNQRWWQWYRYCTRYSHEEKMELRENMCKALDEYFEWALKNSYTLDYKKERIQIHKDMAREYFQGNS